MYTRNYFSDAEALTIPKNYDGTALRESEDIERAPLEVGRDAIGDAKISPIADIPVFIPSEEFTPEKEEKREVSDSDGATRASLFSNFPLKGLLSGGFSNMLGLDKFKLGSEEILIIAVAAFLFFTKGADKECAIILLLLLLVN